MICWNVSIGVWQSRTGAALHEGAGRQLVRSAKLRGSVILRATPPQSRIQRLRRPIHSTRPGTSTASNHSGSSPHAPTQRV